MQIWVFSETECWKKNEEIYSELRRLTQACTGAQGAGVSVPRVGRVWCYIPHAHITRDHDFGDAGLRRGEQGDGRIGTQSGLRR